MSKTILSTAFILLVALLIGTQTRAQKKDPVIMTISGEDVKVSEFEAVYKKNNKDEEVDRADLAEYLELYINFKLKVKEAEALGMDTILKFQEELKGYQKQLAKPYLTDKSVTEALVQEAYERMKSDVKASHILLKVDPDALPKDTLAVYNRIVEMRNDAIKNNSFGKLAAKNSEDPSAKTNQGDLGYFTGLRMVYPFESAAYTTKVGEISMPIRTRFGYHIIKVEDMRPAQGEVLAAHIMIKTPKDATEEQNAESKKKIDEVAALLKEGKEFAKLAAKYSDDKGSAEKGGVLPWFGTGRMVPEFETAAFALENDGDITEPVKSSYGWHIIQRKERKAQKAFEDMESDLRAKVAKDSRSQQSKIAVLSKVKKEYGYTVNEKAVAALSTKLDSTVFDGKWEVWTTKENPKTVMQIGETVFNQKDFGDYIASHQVRRKPVDMAVLVNSFFKQFSEEELLKYEEGQLSNKYPEYKALLKEYRDGILLFDLTDQKVWSKAVKDTTGLADFHKGNGDKYMWEQRVDATIYFCKDDTIATVVTGLMDAINSEKITNDSLLKRLNASSKLNLRVEDDKFQKDENELIDAIAWKKGVYGPTENNGRQVIINVKEVLKPGPKTLREARGLVTADYQDKLEKDWIKELRSKYKYKVSKEHLELIK
ncbi:MAG: peptidyl-prolyl cis-trans isomerase SurA [Bacteroidia bacterium]|jgi:peptidyl-prolyl cis-trans isomerase SurA